MSNTLEEIYFVSQILAVGAVAVSPLFVGFHIRQNSGNRSQNASSLSPPPFAELRSASVSASSAKSRRSTHRDTRRWRSRKLRAWSTASRKAIATTPVPSPDPLAHPVPSCQSGCNAHAHAAGRWPAPPRGLRARRDAPAARYRPPPAKLATRGRRRVRRTGSGLPRSHS